MNKPAKWGQNCIIGDDVVFGQNVRLGHNVIIEDHVRLGDNIVIEENTIVRGGETSLGIRTLVRIVSWASI